MSRFRDRVAGSTLLPFTVKVQQNSGAPFDLTGGSALWTIRRASGAMAVVDSAAHTNTPGAAGIFEYQPAVADVSDPGEYFVTVEMTIAGRQEVGRFGLRILPAF